MGIKEGDLVMPIAAADGGVVGYRVVPPGFKDDIVIPVAATDGAVGLRMTSMAVEGDLGLPGVAADQVAVALKTPLDWLFTDSGFIAGGQDGEYREYNDPSEVEESPWSVLSGGRKLRLDWEDDDNCAGYNPYTQTATAKWEFSVGRDTTLRINWAGVAEVQDENYEVMDVKVDGDVVGSAHAPGGGQGCSSMAPVVSDPNPPVEVLLRADENPHTIYIYACTNDQLYHFGAWYEWWFEFEEA